MMVDKRLARPRFKPPGSLVRPSADEVGQAQAEALALEALVFLSADSARLVHFLDVTGLSPADLRSALVAQRQGEAAARGMLIASLDHLLGEEGLLLEFAANAGCTPESLGNARARLAPTAEPA